MVSTRRSIGSEPLSPGLPSTPAGNTRTSAQPGPGSTRCTSTQKKEKLSKSRQLRQSVPSKSSTRVHLAYDDRMTLHGAPDGNASERAECPARIEAIHGRLMELEHDLGAYHMQQQQQQGNATSPTSERFVSIPVRQATRSEIELIHTAEHYEAIAASAQLSHEDLLAKTDAEEESKDLVWNENTFDSALLAAGAAIDCVAAITDRPASEAVAEREEKCTRAISVCRPPGHHASAGAADGFCYFNNVALAACHALHSKRARRIVILDWDVHHGNGTQDIFYDNEHVLFISLHRFEVNLDHQFYPGTGRPSEVGSTRAKGMNLNVAWTEEGMGDEEHAAALSELILPIMSAFHPDLFLISAGFDAAEGDPVGDCSLTPRGYYAMTRAMLKTIGHDVPVLAVLEGGYNLKIISECMHAVALAFLDEPFEPALRDLIRAESLPREVLEELFGPTDEDEDDAAAYDKLPKTTEQVERRQTMVRRGTTFGRQELLGFWKHPHRGDLDIEPRGRNVTAKRDLKLSAIRDINESMRYLRNCPFWRDMWSMNIVDLHDIPEVTTYSGDVTDGGDDGERNSERDVAAVQDMFGGMKI
mmetsp:Transcript_14999/g.33496  ORF Transcript_14999/g.33496 Transcript_14999/m.33496 type:complete len:588 (-) Transcript_14999:4390-6153(-)